MGIARKREGLPGDQSLQTCGPAARVVRPDAAMCALRASGRHRDTWRDDRAAHLPHMQKALQQMHVPWPQVRTERTGTTGLALIRAIVAGERDPVHLARCRAVRCAQDGGHR